MADITLSPGDHEFAEDGVTFAYFVSGNGPPLVMQSVGWGPSSSLYRGTLKPLEAEFTVIYFEPRGNGKSTRPASQDCMGTITQAYDLEHLRVHLELQHLFILGHSSGGAIALAYAERFPDRVSKLILVDHTLLDFKDDSFQQIATKRRDHPIYGPAIKALINMLTTPPNSDLAMAAGLTKALPYYFTDPSKAQLVAKNMGQPPSIWAFRTHGACDKASPFPHTAELAAVTAKTLIIFGRDDAVCPIAIAERTQQGIRASKLVIIENAGHFPWIELPERFFKEVVSFSEEE